MKKQTYKKNDKVQFAKPLDDDEATLIMYVIEDRDDRVLVVTPFDSLTIQPTNVFPKSELQSATLTHTVNNV